MKEKETDKREGKKKIRGRTFVRGMHSDMIDITRRLENTSAMIFQRLVQCIMHRSRAFYAFL